MEEQIRCTGVSASVRSLWKWTLLSEHFFPSFSRVHRQQRTSRAVLLLAYGALKQKLLYLKTPLVGIMVHRAPTASKMVDKQTSRNWDVLRRKSCWGDGLMLGEWGGLTGVWRSRWRPSAAEILSVLSFGSPRSSCKAFRVFSLITCETIECAFFALLFTPSLVFFSSSLCVFAFDCFVPVHTLGLGTPLSGRTAKISCHICFLLSPSHSMFYLFLWSCFRPSVVCCKHSTYSKVILPRRT